MRPFSRFLNHNILTRRIKNIRNRMVDSHFRNRPAVTTFLPDNFSPAGALVFVTAYNSHPCIDVMLRQWRAMRPQATLVVVDNSSSGMDRERIEQLSREGEVPYIGLPKNPEWNPNRSHGIALNWVYYNLVIQWQPEIFGFLDHDCFPFEPFDLASIMEGYELFGLKANSASKPSQWSLWAGFCFYRFSKVKGIEVDFKHVVEDQLDTGGGNWHLIYQHCQDDEVLFCREKEGVIFDRFYHVGGASYKHDFSNVSELEAVLPDYCKFPRV